MSETRAEIQVGTCPACNAAIEMVLRVELGAAAVEPVSVGKVTVRFEFGQPVVTGAVLKPHDCMKPADAPTARR